MRRRTMLLILVMLSVVVAMGGCASSPTPAPAPARTSTPAPAPTLAPTPTATPTTKAATAKAATAADLYGKEMVTLICNYAAGGGTDYAARLFSSYWPDVTGGTMVVKNKAGGGGLSALNDLYVAKPDGLSLVVADLAAVIGPVAFEDPGVAFKLDKFIYIGTFGDAAPYVFSVGAQQPYQSMKDLQSAKGLVMPTAGIGGSSTIAEAMVIEFFQLDGKILTGYSGSAECTLAIGRGEGQCLSHASVVIREAVGKKYVKPPFVIVSSQRTKHWPETPSIPELVNLTPEQTKLLKLYDSLFLADRKAIFAPPGLPEDKVRFLRDTFSKVVAIEAFATQSKLRWPIWVPPTNGDEQAKEIETVSRTTKEDIGMLQAIVKKYVK